MKNEREKKTNVDKKKTSTERETSRERRKMELNTEENLMNKQ